MRVAVIGTGYVGAVTGVCLSYLGHAVTCVDMDEEKIARLRRGEIPIYEPGLADLMRLAQERGGDAFTTGPESPLSRAAISFFRVGPPPLPRGRTKLTRPG